MDTQSLMGEHFTPSSPPTSDEKTMAILSHMLSIVSSFIGPLVIYLVKKDESPFVAEHARESLNFQITMFICLGLPVVCCQPGIDHRGHH